MCDFLWKYKVAIIGRTPNGNYGHQLDQTFVEHPSTEIVAVSDPNKKGAEECMLRTGAKIFYLDYKEMLSKEEIDIVVVAPRYTDCHEDMVISALKANCHVYCEKPLAQDLLQVNNIMKHAETRNLKVGVALPFIHESRYSKLLKMISQNLIGKVIRMKGMCKHDSRGGGQDFGVLGPHLTEMMRYVAGNPIWGYGSVTINGKTIDYTDTEIGDEGLGLIAGDNIFAYYQFENDITGTVETAKLNINERAEQPYRLEIYGEKGILFVKAPYADHSIWYYPRPFINPELNLWKKIDTEIIPSYGDYHKRAAVDFIKALEQDRNPLCSIYDFQKSLEMLLLPYYSTIGKTPIRFPIKSKDHPLKDKDRGIE